MEWKRKASAVLEIPQRLNTILIAVAIAGTLSIIAIIMAFAAVRHAD